MLELRNFCVAHLLGVKMKVSRDVVQQLRSAGVSASRIARIFKIHLSSVYRLCSTLEEKKKRRCSVTAKRRRVLVEKLRRVIQESPTGWRQRRFPSTRSIQREVKRRTGIKHSHMTIYRDLQLTSSNRVRKRVTCVNPKHIDKRRQFVERHKVLHRVVWSDECQVLLNDSSCRTEWIADGEETTCRLKDGWAERIMIWAAIGKNYRSPIVVIKKNAIEPNKRMDSRQYIAQCLSKIKPYLQSSRSRLMQDGAKAHTAKATTAYLHRNGIAKVEGWPAKSPDLNGIELAWALLKRKVSERLPTSVEELTAMIKEEWKKIPQSTINRWATHYNRRSKVVREKQGKW